LGNAIAIGFLRSNDAEAFKVLLYIAVLIVAVGCLMLSITPQLFPLHRQTSELVVVESAWAVRPSATELRTAESKSSESLIDPALDTLKSKPFDSFKQQMRDLWLLIKSDKCRLLMPYMICQGVNISFDFGNFPKYIAYACLNLTDPQLASDAESPVIPLHISQVFLLYGVGSILGALLWGRVYDRLMGRLTPLLVAHVLLVTLSTSLLMSTVFVPLINSSVSLLSLIGFLFGLTDFLTNSIINNSASKLFHGSDVARLYSWYRFCFCIGYAVNAFISGLTPRLEAYSDPLVGGGGWAKFGWLTNVVFSVSMMLISVVAGYRLDRAIISNSQKHCQEEEEDSQVIYASKSMEVTTT
jgi:hypothetical protein